MCPTMTSRGVPRAFTDWGGREEALLRDPGMCKYSQTAVRKSDSSPQYFILARSLASTRFVYDFCAHALHPCFDETMEHGHDG